MSTENEPDPVAPHPRFEEALRLLDGGQVEQLRALLAGDPSLVHARTNLDPSHGYFSGATLLHHVAGNPKRPNPLPGETIQIGRVLLEAGAEADAKTLHGWTTMGLVLTSAQASEREFSAPLIDLLLEFGGTVSVSDPGALDGSLANHAPRAAEKLIALGAEPDLFAAAGLGRMDWLRDCFTDTGRLLRIPTRPGRIMTEADAIGLAALYAYVAGRSDAVDFLLDRAGNWNMTGVNNGTLLHRAAWAGDLPMVERLVGLGADLANRDNPFRSTPLSWAVHNRQFAVVDWLRANTRVDLHDAVCLGFLEQVEARLQEEPASVHRHLDQWELTHCTPLHWAVAPAYEDIAGIRPHDPETRVALVRRLLACGADPGARTGDGLTPVDLAEAWGAGQLADILREGSAPGHMP